MVSRARVVPGWSDDVHLSPVAHYQGQKGHPAPYHTALRSRSRLVYPSIRIGIHQWPSALRPADNHGVMEVVNGLHNNTGSLSSRQDGHDLRDDLARQPRYTDLSVQRQITHVHGMHLLSRELERLEKIYYMTNSLLVQYRRVP